MYNSKMKMSKLAPIGSERKNRKKKVEVPHKSSSLLLSLVIRDVRWLIFDHIVSEDFVWSSNLRFGPLTDLLIACPELKEDVEGWYRKCPWLVKSPKGQIFDPELTIFYINGFELCLPRSAIIESLCNDYGTGRAIQRLQISLSNKAQWQRIRPYLMNLDSIRDLAIRLTLPAANHWGPYDEYLALIGEFDFNQFAEDYLSPRIGEYSPRLDVRREGQLCIRLILPIPYATLERCGPVWLADQELQAVHDQHLADIRSNGASRLTKSGLASLLAESVSTEEAWKKYYPNSRSPGGTNSHTHNPTNSLLWPFEILSLARARLREIEDIETSYERIEQSIESLLAEEADG